jgi:phytoene desaturase
MPKKIIVIGTGFAGLAAATSLAQKGYDVTVLEKNATPGGRARQLKADGFTFDMGPSWYWMPDIFETYFARFGKKPSDYYQLERLDPSYSVVFPGNELVKLPAGTDKIADLFESFEPGVKPKFYEFMKQGAYKYEVGINKFVWKPSKSITEFLNLKLAYDALRLQITQSLSQHARKFFKSDKIIKLVEFPVLFLGATPQKIPAMYSLMNYAEIEMGTWYPVGGMYSVVDGMVRLAQEQGVKFLYNQNVVQINVEGKNARKVTTDTNTFEADIVVAGCDYHHVEDKLVDKNYRNYSEAYWDKRMLAPSSLMFYLGVNKEIPNLEHHVLFFDEDFDLHAKEIYETPKWPTRPQFYLSATSKTDKSVAPEGHENLVLLIPLAAGLQDSEEMREKYYNIIMERLEKFCGVSIRDAVVFKRSYAMQDFKDDYNAYKGNAYGLANTLLQTAFLKPTLKNKKVNNLYYTGQLTVPGPGVPPSLISGLVVADEVEKEYSIA